ncbi:unnamed protein product [Paramecium sonneborni]|uniref:Uncharacterized protein n=1 Tax=Paramecium sonneborni TaxID=65129 RepID=A0A8S1LM28_9CILI|nr:unnamed protein product [Paramecium sonneborni]
MQHQDEQNIYYRKDKKEMYSQLHFNSQFKQYPLKMLSTSLNSNKAFKFIVKIQQRIQGRQGNFYCQLGCYGNSFN